MRRIALIAITLIALAALVVVVREELPIELGEASQQARRDSLITTQEQSAGTEASSDPQSREELRHDVSTTLIVEIDSPDDSLVLSFLEVRENGKHGNLLADDWVSHVCGRRWRFDGNIQRGTHVFAHEYESIQDLPESVYISVTRGLNYGNHPPSKERIVELEETTKLPQPISRSAYEKHSGERLHADGDQVVLLETRIWRCAMKPKITIAQTMRIPVPLSIESELSVGYEVFTAHKQRFYRTCDGFWWSKAQGTDTWKDSVGCGAPPGLHYVLANGNSNRSEGLQSKDFADNHPIHSLQQVIGSQAYALDWFVSPTELEVEFKRDAVAEVEATLTRDMRWHHLNCYPHPSKRRLNSMCSHAACFGTTEARNSRIPFSGQASTIRTITKS